ncbi:hypothetical protein MRX96_031684 [Rhipicephalus microplus]
MPPDASGLWCRVHTLPLRLLMGHHVLTGVTSRRRRDLVTSRMSRLPTCITTVLVDATIAPFRFHDTYRSWCPQASRKLHRRMKFIVVAAAKGWNCVTGRSPLNFDPVVGVARALMR